MVRLSSILRVRSLRATCPSRKSRQVFAIAEERHKANLRDRGQQGDEHLNQGQRRRPHKQLEFDGHAFLPG
jgi:hypothetical protein